jgi:raffinose/stachyose/melibiose transport system permease protein
VSIAARRKELGGGRPGEGAGIANLLFVIPALTLYALFVLWPLAASLYYSLTEWDGIGQPRWVGLANFARAIGDDIHLASYIHVTLYILGTLIFEVSFGLVMAVLLNSDRPGFGLLRGLFFSPVVLSMSAAGVLWTFVFDYRTGLVNAVLKEIGLSGWAQPWLSQPATALLCVMLVSGWKFAGFYMILFFAALRRIPRSLYEAATLEGAGPLRRFFSITLPLLKQNILICVLLAVTGGFAGFDLFFTMTNGQPYNSTEVPVTWIVKMGFDSDQLGYGIALTVILTVVVSLISLVYLRFAERSHAVEY